MSQIDKIKAHFIHEDHGVLSKMHLNDCPRVGDEVRLPGPKYYLVTRVIWVYDEPETPMQRVNIGLKDAPLDE